jgi:membrane-bound serine protease (ClpP class)
VTGASFQTRRRRFVAAFFFLVLFFSGLAGLSRGLWMPAGYAAPPGTPSAAASGPASAEPMATAPPSAASTSAAPFDPPPIRGLPSAEAGRGAGRKVVVIPIDGTIDHGTRPLRRTRRCVKHADAALLILDVDTFGGRVDAAVRIRDALLRSELPIVAFVDNRAISAGALISLAADHIVFAPGASMGAATPVQMEGGQAKAVEEKTVSYMRSEMRATAEATGRPAALAEAMVDADIAIEGVIAKGKLLTVTTEKPSASGSPPAKLKTSARCSTPLGLPEAEVVRPSVNWAERVARFLTDPVVSGLLMSLGMLGLLMEFYTPGFGIVGALGLLCLLLFFGGSSIAGLAGWEEFVIFALGGGLLAVEVFVIPGFGIAGVLGIALISIALVMAMLGMPLSTSWEIGALGDAMTVVLFSLVATALAMIVLIRYLPGSFLGRWLVLDATLGGSPTGEGAEAGRRMGRGPGRQPALPRRARPRGDRAAAFGAGALRRRHGRRRQPRPLDRPRHAGQGRAGRGRAGGGDRRRARRLSAGGIVLDSTSLLIAIGVAGLIGVFLFFYFVPVGLYIAARLTGAGVGIGQLIAMRLRRVRPTLIVNPRISAVKAGLNLSIDQLESHYLAGGNVQRVVYALISAQKAGISLTFERAAAIDLAGRDVLEAVKMSVNPKVIETPKVSAVAADGIQLIAISRITLRANIDRLVGGAGEETILARVGEGIVTTIGSSSEPQRGAREPRPHLRSRHRQGPRCGHGLRDPLHRHRRRRRRQQHRREAADGPGRGRQEHRAGASRGPARDGGRRRAGDEGALPGSARQGRRRRSRGPARDYYPDAPKKD